MLSSFLAPTHSSFKDKPHDFSAIPLVFGVITFILIVVLVFRLIMTLKPLKKIAKSRFPPERHYHQIDKCSGIETATDMDYIETVTVENRKVSSPFYASKEDVSL